MVNYKYFPVFYCYYSQSLKPPKPTVFVITCSCLIFDSALKKWKSIALKEKPRMFPLNVGKYLGDEFLLGVGRTGYTFFKEKVA